MKRIRHFIQFMFSCIFNGYIIGFIKGTIYRNNGKVLCLPVLNCYSCPGAIGACPIGSLQAVLGDRGKKFSFYIFGFMALFGVFMGRFICGFLCPFGFIQDLLYKIKIFKIKIPNNIDRPLRWLKYIILIIFVIVLPIVITNKFGIGMPYFCKYLCPVGILEGAFPLMAANKALREIIGGLFVFKLSILIFVIILSIFVYRPFCKYLCPLGAFYGLFNKFSFYRMSVDENKCSKCMACEKVCKMNVKITENINSSECIRCGECKNICKNNAIKTHFLVKDK